MSHKLQTSNISQKAMYIDFPPRGIHSVACKNTTLSMCYEFYRVTHRFVRTKEARMSIGCISSSNPNFKGGSAKPPLKSGHGSMITSLKTGCVIIIHTLISFNLSYKWALRHSVDIGDLSRSHKQQHRATYTFPFTNIRCFTVNQKNL